MRASFALVAVALGCMAARAQEPDLHLTEAAQLAIARGLDIDYRKCAAVVLSEQIRQLTESDTAYISIMGEDPDSATLASLRRVHARTTLGSKLPPFGHTHHSHTWSFYFGDLRATASEEYVATAGFLCGSLCAETREYRLRKEGDSCSIASSKILWQS
jgi:hypothetical protein